MDFFDPEKQKQHAIRLRIGYGVIGITLILATVILLYQAYGFGLDKNGRVFQNGLVFVASTPTGADVFVNSVKYKDQTNTRMNLPANQYILELKRSGYHTWKRVLTVEGGSVERFEYPFLFPLKPTTTVTKQYAAMPGLSTSSLDHRWLLVATPDQNVFDLFDLNQTKPITRTVTISSEILAAGSVTKSWEAVEWAKDNRHVLLKRTYEKPGQTSTEYILFDREDPALSQNLSVLLGFTPTVIELRDSAYDQYYLFDQTSSQLFTASLGQPTPQPFISSVLGFASLGDRVLYATTEGAAPDKVLIRLRSGSNPAITIRQASTATSYLLDLAVYGGNLYAGAGAQNENRVHIYKDPLGQLRDDPKAALVPVQILKVPTPNYLAFSANKRFVITQNGNNFAVYDAQTDRSYAYQTKPSLDAPQGHAVWINGFRLGYVSAGALVVFDFDGTNLHSLSPAHPALVPAFDRKYQTLYTIDTKNALTSTVLLMPKDL